MKLEDVPVVRDYPDVFVDECFNLPLEREMEFANDLVPRTHLISLPPYRITPVSERN